MSEPAPRQPSVPPIDPGTVLAGKYRVERILGQGGMGVVVEARHIALDERVALKFLLPEPAQKPEAAARFLREARAAVRIKSEHVARVTDHGTLDTGEPYMVMELLVGSDLAKVLDERGPLPVDDALDYVIQACEAIAEAHALGIVHRDLKPGNLFLTQRPDGSPLIKLLDFGISKVMSSGEDLTGTAATIGSALYMSPEQMKQTRSVDHRTDIYALGVVLYELLAGKQPFRAATLPQLCVEVMTGDPTPLLAYRPDLSEELAAVLAQAYARDREERHASVAHLVVALAPFAPARSQPSIERIARLGGLQPPAACAPALTAPFHVGRDSAFAGPSNPAVTPLPLQRVVTPIPIREAAATPSPAPPLQGHILSIPMPPLHLRDQIIPGPYNGPASARASATFASAASRQRPKLPLVVVLAVTATLLGVGALVFFVMVRIYPAPEVVATGAPPAPAVDTIAAPPPVVPPPAPEEPPQTPPADTAAPPPDTQPAADTGPAKAPTAAPTQRGATGRPAAGTPPRPAKTVDLDNPGWK